MIYICDLCGTVTYEHIIRDHDEYIRILTTYQTTLSCGGRTMEVYGSPGRAPCKGGRSSAPTFLYILHIFLTTLPPAVVSCTVYIPGVSVPKAGDKVYSPGCKVAS